MPKKPDFAKYEAVYACIRRYTEEHGYAPSVREIAADCGISSTSVVARILRRLKEDGRLRMTDMKSRSIRLTVPFGAAGQAGQTEQSQQIQQAQYDTRLCQLPLIGRAAGGAPILAEQCMEDVIPLPASRFGKEGMYLLTIKGDSMQDVGICDGDMVVVRQADTAENGDIVVALIDDEATVKRFYKEDGRYRLQPENRHMQPIVTDHVRVQGIVTDVIHHLQK